MNDPRALLERAFRAAVAAADPEQALAPHWPAPPAGRLAIVAVGKAAERMARAAERRYAGLPLEGFVVTPHGAEAPPGGPADEPARRLERRSAAHPLPDAASLEAGELALELASGLGERDLLLALISGGGSALLCAPAGVDLAALRALNEALLRSGADIAETNTVRRALSRVKGGRLAALAHPATVVGLALSDVVGDAPSDIASGPTVADPSDAAAALRILERYDIDSPAREALRRAEEGRPSQGGARVAPGDARLARARTRVVASNQGSLEAAAAAFGAAGTPAAILASAVTGDAREAAALHAAVAAQVWRHGQPWPAPVAVLSGGETTVRVRGSGRGGRNSTFALALALRLPEGAPVWALAADSDGIDGVGGHGGAFVTPALFEALPREEAAALLAADDSYAAFARADHLFVPGATGTNVNDLRFLLVAP